MYGQMLESKETACREEDRARIHPIVGLMQLLSNSFDLFFSEGKQAGKRFEVLVLTTVTVGFSRSLHKSTSTRTTVRNYGGSVYCWSP